MSDIWFVLEDWNPSFEILFNAACNGTATSDWELIYKILKEARKDFLQNKDVFVFQKYNSIYSNANLKIDYLEILDLKTFSTPLDNTENYIIIIAAIVDGLRLIDNIEFKLEKLWNKLLLLTLAIVRQQLGLGALQNGQAIVLLCCSSNHKKCGFSNQ